MTTARAARKQALPHLFLYTVAPGDTGGPTVYSITDADIYY